MLIAGDEDMANGAVSFRYRNGAQKNGVPVDEAIAEIVEGRGAPRPGLTRPSYDPSRTARDLRGDHGPSGFSAHGRGLVGGPRRHRYTRAVRGSGLIEPTSEGRGDRSPGRRTSSTVTLTSMTCMPSIRLTCGTRWS